MNIGKIKLTKVQTVKTINNFKIRGRFAFKKIFGHHLQSGLKLGHFGSDPLPPDKNVLIFNYYKIRFSN